MQKNQNLAVKTSETQLAFLFWAAWALNGVLAPLQDLENGLLGVSLRLPG